MLKVLTLRMHCNYCSTAFPSPVVIRFCVNVVLHALCMLISMQMKTTAVCNAYCECVVLGAVVP